MGEQFPAAAPPPPSSPAKHARLRLASSAPPPPPALLDRAERHHMCFDCCALCYLSAPRDCARCSLPLLLLYALCRLCTLQPWEELGSLGEAKLLSPASNSLSPNLARSCGRAVCTRGPRALCFVLAAWLVLALSPGAARAHGILHGMRTKFAGCLSRRMCKL